MTFTERADNSHAHELRAIIKSHIRLSFTEKRGWFSTLFTVEGDEPYVSRCIQEIEDWLDQKTTDAAW